MNLSKISGTKKSKVKKNGEKKESISDDDFQSNLMKIVVNFLQVSTIIFQYKFDWPDFVIIFTFSFLNVVLGFKSYGRYK